MSLLPQVTGAGLLGILLAVFVLVALLVAPRNKKPSSALAWILLITFVPVLGLLLFLVIGSPQLPWVRQERQRNMDELIATRSSRLEDQEHLPGAPDWLPAVARLNRVMGAMPLLEDNQARLLVTFEEQVQAIIAAVAAAELDVNVEFYILSYDESTAPVFEALRAAVGRGVVVRVLLDHLGSRGYPGYARTCRELTDLGARWHLMLPVQPLRGRYQRPDLRNHRKLVTVDGRVAFTGSMNLIDPGYQKRSNRRRGLRWVDLMVEVRGNVVREVEAVFITDWYSETEELLEPTREVQASGPPGTHSVEATRRRGGVLAQVAPSGPAFPAENNLALFNSLIYQARRRLSITSPYFVPDESLLAAIVTAARRGVQVELFVGEVGDQFFVHHAQHSYYESLLNAGVRIHLFPGPNILHSKHVSVDEDVAVIGSSNMDVRSFQLDLEVSLLLCGRRIVEDLRAVEDAYRAVSTELTRAEHRRWPRLHRVVDDLARLTSAVQ